MNNKHKAPIYAADFGGGNFEKKIVTAGQDPELLFWDFTKGVVDKELTFYFKQDKKDNSSKHVVWVSDVSWEKEAGKIVATSFVDGTVAAYEVKWGKTQNYVIKASYKNKNHFGAVNSVTFLQNRRSKVASCGVDGMIIIHDLYKPGAEEVIFAHASNVTSIATHRNEPNFLISSSSDKTCKVWDIRTNKEKNTFADLNSSANTVCINPAANCFAVGCDDGTCRLYDWRYSSDEVTSYYDDENRPEPIDNVCFAADGGLLIATYGSTVACCNAMPSETASPFDKFDFSLVEDKKGGYLTRLISHDTLKRFATTSVDRTVKLWKVSQIKKN